jgi:hypothetical protein
VYGERRAASIPASIRIGAAKPCEFNAMARAPPIRIIGVLIRLAILRAVVLGLETQCR